MTLDQWMLFWKIVLVAGMIAFAVLAVTVSIGGFYDIRRLFKRLRERQTNDS